MTKPAPTAFALLLPAVVVLAGCVAEPATDATGPAPSVSSGPSSTASAPVPLPAGPAIEDWAATALPEDRAGAPAAVLREVGSVTRAAGIVADISQPAGPWDLVMTCQSVDGAPLAWRIASPSTASDDTVDLDCTTPNGGVPTTSVATFDGPGAQVEFSATSDAVVAYEVRPHAPPLD